MNTSENFSCRAARTLAEIAAASDRPLALAIGVFDGVHCGHRKLIDTVCNWAERLHARPVALTFDPHPRAVLHPAAPPVLLVGVEERVRLLRAAGMADVAVANFTPEFARTEPEAFLDVLLERVPQLAAVGVGEHWRFGARGRGDVALLSEYAVRRGWQLAAVPELMMGGDVVSASRIRGAVAGGDLKLAAGLLGYSYYWMGRVAGGYGIAGTHLNCPTANIVPEAGVLPPDGVYAGTVTVGEVRYPAAVNIGVAPTYARAGSPVRRVEAHLLDFDGDLYGCRVRLDLIRYLRSEQCFASENELKMQIRSDVGAIRRLVKQEMELPHGA